MESIDALAGTEGVPPVIGAFQGDNRSMVAFLFEHAPAFEGVGHAPRAALRRFYRRLPVVLALDSGVIRAAWHETIPASAEVLATFAAS